MRLLPVILALAFAAPAAGQISSRIYTRAQEPAFEALDRLNLRIEWRASLPSESIRDGIARVQWLDDQVFVQMRSSLVVALDAATGRALWQVRPYHPYGNIYHVAVNPKYVYFVNGTRLYAYDRYKGIQDFEFDLGTTVSAGPVADNEAVYLPLANARVVKYGLPYPVKVLKPRAGRTDAKSATQQQDDAARTPEGRIFRGRRSSEDIAAQLRILRPSIQLDVQGTEAGNEANRTPSISILPTLRPPYRLDNGGKSESISILATLQPPYQLDNGSTTPSITILNSVVRLGQLNDLSPRGIEPRKIWEHPTGAFLPFRPLLTNDRLVAPTSRGLAIALGLEQGEPVYEFETDGAISASVGQYADTAYVPTASAQLFAVNMVTGRVEWRYTGGGILNHAPVVTDAQVFVSGYLSGVSAVDRKDGSPQWTHEKSERVLAANPKFVYTLDRLGNLYVLDRVRGTELSHYPVSDFNVPAVNHENDRLLLAANNGLLLSIRDRDYVAPVLLKNPPKAEEVKKEEPKKEEPKQPEPKEPAPKKDAKE